MVIIIIFCLFQDECVGCPRPATDDETTTKVNEWATQAIAKIQGSAGETCDFDGVQNVKTKVVAGVKYISDVSYKCGNAVSVCELEIWHQSWTGLLRFYWNCPELKKFSSNSRTKRGLIGGHRELPAEEVKALEYMVISALKEASERNPERNYQ